MKGDVVEVTEGDLKGLKGRVEKVEEGEVIIKPMMEGLTDLLPVRQNQLRKFFRTGDHVKVIAGQHEGDTGLIIKIEGQIVVIYSDTAKEHIKVFARDIMSSSEVTTGLAQIGEFELHDLIQLDQMTFGVIVKIEKSGCQVLKGTAERADVITVKLREIRKKIFDSKASVQDADSNVINIKDPVKVIMGQYKGRQGSAEHIHRGVVFVYDRSLVDNGGYFCVRSRSCAALSANAATAGISRLGGNAPSLGWKGGASRFDQRGMPMRSPSHLLQSPRNFPGSPSRNRQGGHGTPGSYGGGRMGHRRDDGLVGRVIKIRSGPFKGYRGRVLDATDTTARIELESQMKVVTVNRNQLPEAGALQNQPTPFRDNSQPSFRLGSETPMHPSRTPMHPGRFDPSATPMHEGMRTPMRDRAWNAQVPATPVRTDAWDEANPATWGLSGGNTSSLYTAFTPTFSPADSAPSPADSQNPLTPGLQQFDTDTPDSSAHNYNPSTPFSNVPSPYQVPTPSAQTPGTPGGGGSYLAGTPGSMAGDFPGTPGMGGGYLPGTPGSIPMTPGGALLDPTSPAMGGEGDKGFLPGVAVLVATSGAREREVAVIREVLQDGSYRVATNGSSDDDLFVVSPSDVELVLPKKYDKVKILQGEHRGSTGKLIGTDGAEGIVKISESDVKVLMMDMLGKLISA